MHCFEHLEEAFRRDRDCSLLRSQEEHDCEDVVECMIQERVDFDLDRVQHSWCIALASYSRKLLLIRQARSAIKILLDTNVSLPVVQGNEEYPS